MKFHCIKVADIFTSPSTAQHGETKMLSNGPELVEEQVELACLKSLSHPPTPTLINLKTQEKERIVCHGRRIQLCSSLKCKVIK